MKLAIVLFNLGGPDRPEAVRPFLLNLFRDPAILRVPGFVRPFLARLIARARVRPATENYAILGGRSPLLDLTQDQARALERALPEIEARCFIAMRYWHPMSNETVRAVKAWAPHRVVLMPLYPQFSTTTTGSSLSDWRRAAADANLVCDTTTLCCYFDDPAYVASAVSLLDRAYAEARAKGHAPRVLFSAHGLPESIVRAGDPYQFQVERTVASVLRAWNRPEVESLVCYQSRATPQRWIGPSTEEAIEQAGRDGRAVLIQPIAFVSEHSETLVELDVEYRHLAERCGVPAYFRVPAQNDDATFIEALARLVRAAVAAPPGLRGSAGGASCPAGCGDCPHIRAGAGSAPAATEPPPRARALAEAA